MQILNKQNGWRGNEEKGNESPMQRGTSLISTCSLGSPQTFRSRAQTSIDRAHKPTSISSRFLAVVSFKMYKYFVHHTFSAGMSLWCHMAGVGGICNGL